MPARVSCGSIKSRKLVNCEKTTDFVFGGTRERWLRREWILAEVCVEGERGLILRSEIRGIVRELEGGALLSTSSSAGVELGDWCLITSKMSFELTGARQEKHLGGRFLSV